jgi:hypothetical protein
VLWLAAGVALVVLGDRFIFFPEREVAETPADYGLAYQAVRLVAGDGVKLHAWWIPAGAEAPAALWLHGNAGNIATRLPLARGFHDAGLALLALEWRGYGRSEGEPSEDGLVLDAVAGMRWLRERAMPVFIYGESLGAVVAALAAAREGADALVLQAGFTSLAGMAALAFPFLPARFMVRGRFNAEGALAKIEAPVMIIHGDRDEVIPFTQGEQLHRAADRSRRRELVRVPGGGHNDLHAADPSLYRRARDFFATAR